ncbi:MAG: hypothetical protein JEY91_07320 [Spirochaetaceae bacterium]|nr:hypothetical protein [Spirochaetaceae bacterium]
MNKSPMEIKEQHLPYSYSELSSQLINKRYFSLLEDIRLTEDSYFYLVYKSDEPINIEIDDLKNSLPSSNKVVTYYHYLDKSVTFNAFEISSQGISGNSVLLECGIVPFDSQMKGYDLSHSVFFKNNIIRLYYSLSDSSSAFSLTFTSEENALDENLQILINDSSQYSIKTRTGLNQYWFYNNEFESTMTQNVEIVSENARFVGFNTDIVIHESEAIPSDLEDFINWNRASWRQSEYELFRWDLFPGMLLIDTENYRVQSAFFKRMAFFTEKKNTVGEFLTEGELKQLHGWNAHDYRALDLARFFNRAFEEDFPLNDHEILLMNMLIDNGVLEKSDNRVRPLKGGILSISRESDERLRWLFLTHECYHGLFFSSHEYVEKIYDLWERLSEVERDFWRTFLDMYGYDVSDEYLLINEFQAYLMQQPVHLADSYFRSKISWILSLKPYLQNTMNNLLSEYGDTFSRSAEAVENVAFSIAGIRAGDLVLKRKK